MNQIWTEEDIILVGGEKCLNADASERFYQLYKDKLPERGKSLYKLDWAVRVCNAVPRTYEPVVSKPAPPAELDGANNVYNIANLNLVMEDFDKEYAKDSKVDVANYVLTKLHVIISARPIMPDDMLKFVPHIMSSHPDANWDERKFYRTIEQGRIKSTLKQKGLEATLVSVADKPYLVIDVINEARNAKESEDVIKVIVANFLSGQTEDYQQEVVQLLASRNMDDILEFIKKANKPNPDDSNVLATVELYIEDYFKRANPDANKIALLKRLLDDIYVGYGLEPEKYSDLLRNIIVDKEPFNIDILTLTRCLMEKNNSIKLCSKETDELIETYLIKGNEDELEGNLAFICYNTDDNKWDEFTNKLVARLHTDLNSISVVDPVAIKKLYKIVLAILNMHDKYFTQKLCTKFGANEESLRKDAADVLKLVRKASPDEQGPIDLEDGDSGDLGDEDEDEDEFEIISHRKPMTKEGKKKILYASIAGIGLISTLFLTFVLGHNPVTVVAECVKTFGALFKNNATLAQLAGKLGNLSIYFASAIATFKGFFKLADTLDENKVKELEGRKKKRRRAEGDSEEEQPEDDYSFIDEGDLFGGLDDEEITRVKR